MILRFTFLCLSAILLLIAHADMVDTGADLKALPQVPVWRVLPPPPWPMQQGLRAWRRWRPMQARPKWSIACAVALSVTHPMRVS